MRSFSLFSIGVLLTFSFPSKAQGILISSGANIVSSGASSIVINNGGLTNNGAFSPATGSVQFTGSVTGSSFISGSGTTSFYDLIMNRTSGALILNSDITVQHYLTFTSGDSLFLNNHNIDLGATGSLNGEIESRKITGRSGGYVKVTQILNAPFQQNPGNLGMVITSSANLGSTIIKRGHQQQSGASIYRYYDFSPGNNAGLDVSLKFGYFDSELGGIAEANLGMFSSMNNGLNWTNLGASGVNTTSNFVLKDHINNLYRLTLSNINEPLFIKILFFKASQVGDHMEVNWATSGELDNDSIRLQSSCDARNFNNKGQVKGAGNTSAVTYYSLNDYYPCQGMNYYRLSDLDLGGRSAFSQVIGVEFKQSATGSIVVFPNPAQNDCLLELTISTPGIYTIQLLSIDGSILRKRSVFLHQGLNRVNYSLIGLGRAIYFISIAELPVLNNRLFKL